MSIVGMVMTSAMTSATSNAMTRAIIGAVVVTVVVVSTMQIGNKINSRALPYVRRITNNMVATLKRVVAAVVTMEQAMLMCALKNANRR